MITAVLYEDARKFDWLCLTPGDYHSASFPVDRIPVPPPTILTGMYFSRFHMGRLGNPGVQVPRRSAKNLADRRDAIGGFLEPSLAHRDPNN
jgi:hypothetical protein